METYNITWENFGGTWSKYYRTNSVVTAKVEYNETFEGTSYESEDINGWLDYAVAGKMVICSGDFNATSGTRSGTLYVYLDGELETKVLINQHKQNIIIRDTAKLSVNSQQENVDWKGKSNLRIYVTSENIDNLRCTSGNVQQDSAGYYIDIPQSTTAKTYTITFQGESKITGALHTASCKIFQSAMQEEKLTITASGSPASYNGGDVTITVNATNIVLSTIEPVNASNFTKVNPTSWKYHFDSNPDTTSKSVSVKFTGTGQGSGNNIESNQINISQSAKPVPQTSYTFYYNVGTSIPSTQAEIENSANHPQSTTQATFNYNSGNVISCEEFGQKAIWVAMPKSWKLKSWVDEGGRGDEMKNDFVQDTIPLEQQTGYAIIGDYKIYQYSILSPVGLRNSFIISAER